MPGDAPQQHRPNQFALLRERRFAPFFWVQFLGAGNDNLFKFAFTVLVTYQLQVAWLPPALAGLVIGALFILPFLLFSATSGQFADKMDKAVLMRRVKSIEIAIMLIAAAGFVLQNAPVLLACVFLMGLHSTLFGPVKFAYLPQHLSAAEITGGNGMVEMGTFVAILLGQLAGGLLISLPGVGAHLVGLSCLALAVGGRLVAQAVPASPATDPGLAINWNPVSETWRNLKLAHRNAVVFRSLLGISWMWFFGAVFLSMFPAFAKDVLHGDERVASLLLVLFSVGIGAGALLCEAFSRRHVEIGLVPLGAIGMSVFAVDLYFAARGLPAAPRALTVSAFVALPAHWHVMADLALLSLFTGLYSVPMYALIQLRSVATHRARIIAANNILNALFMIVSALGVGVLIGAGVSIPQVFLLIGLLNAVVVGVIFLLVPEYPLRFLAFVLTRCVWRLHVHGDRHIPVCGAAIIVCNRAGNVDALLLMAASARPIRFLVDHERFVQPVRGWLLRRAGAIAFATRNAIPAPHDRAFDAARRALDDGDLLCVFAESGSTRAGSPDAFDRCMLQLRPVPVVPVALQPLRHPFFWPLPAAGAPMPPLPHGWRGAVALHVGAPLAAADASAAVLRERLQSLLAQR